MYMSTPFRPIEQFANTVLYKDLRFDPCPGMAIATSATPARISRSYGGHVSAGSRSNTMRGNRILRATPAAIAASVGLAAALGPARSAEAGGTLTAIGSPDQPIRILEHHVNVVINNGFARTEVRQTFFNPNAADLEAIYSFPVPVSASLSEMTVTISELEIRGEVLPREQAEQAYEEEKSKGSEAGLAVKGGYQDFKFKVTPVRAQSEATVRFVYYQPLAIDTGVGRYVYPLEEGGTDELARSFWMSNQKVESAFSADFELKSAAPVADVRLPGFEAGAVTQKLDAGRYKARIESQGATLDRDLVFYYKLEDNQPGRVELIPYRADDTKPGTFMMVVTPGIDLGPITGGADYTFVLDTSGSMQGKIGTLARGVAGAVGAMRPEDRFRVVTFATSASDLTRGFVAATPENARRGIAAVEGLRPDGSTNLYAGVELALGQLNDDRATSIILVTDGVTNTGVAEPAAFDKLMRSCDVRVFGFLMGNSANWPLMRTICDASGGFYAGVSNADDIIGQIMLAKSKITSECLHDADLRITGVKVFDSTEPALGKVYRGQQLVLFGRYEKGGRATVRLKARLTDEDKTYETTFDFPDIDTDNPEVERLWAMNRVEAIEAQRDRGATPVAEAKTAIRDLGVNYQLVTDETAMVVLADSAFAERGIERCNQQRTATEHAAQATRAAQPVQSRRVDQQQPIFHQPSPGLGGGGGGGGGGALDPFSTTIILSLAGGIALHRRRPEAAG